MNVTARMQRHAAGTLSSIIEQADDSCHTQIPLFHPHTDVGVATNGQCGARVQAKGMQHPRTVHQAVNERGCPRMFGVHRRRQHIAQ
ncbi:hypothetical protein MASR1M101_15110 [Gemmatimonas sp.]